MSKVLEASCVGGVVTCEGVPVPSAEILSQGVGSSAGFLVIDGEKAYYVAKTSPDLESTLTKLIDALTKIVTLFTAVGAGMTGPTTAPPPTLATDLTALTLVITNLTALKAAMK